MLMESANPVRHREDDRFGRWPFASAVADLVDGASRRGAVVIGVEGAWGMGKSSVLEMAAGELRSGGSHRIVRVSAWRTTSQDQFLASLAYAISLSLRRDWSSVWLRLLWARLRRQPLPTWLGFLVPAGLIGVVLTVPGASERAQLFAKADLSTILAGLGIASAPFLGLLLTYAARPVLSSLGGLLGREGLADKSGAMEQFSFEFDVLADAQSGNGRFVVMVEDLDRAAPERVVDVLAAVAQLCGHERAESLGFILAYDRDMVLAAVKASIAKQYPDVDAAASAKSYVDRVVQVGLPLPEKGRVMASPASRGSVVRMPNWLEAILWATVAVVLLSHALLGTVRIPPILDMIGVVAGFGIVVGFLLGTTLFTGRRGGGDPAWRVVEDTVRPLMPDNPRDAVRVANLARAAHKLDTGPGGLTPTEAMAIAAAVDRWPESFDAARIREAVQAGGFGGDGRFMNVDLDSALASLAASGVDTRCFTDAGRLYRYFLAVRGAKAPVTALGGNAAS